MWSKRRKAIVRKLCRGTLNLLRISEKSLNEALLLPVEPEENKTSPGWPLSFNLLINSWIVTNSYKDYKKVTHNNNQCKKEYSSYPTYTKQKS